MYNMHNMTEFKTVQHNHSYWIISNMSTIVALVVTLVTTRYASLIQDMKQLNVVTTYNIYVTYCGPTLWLWRNTSTLYFVRGKLMCLKKEEHISNYCERSWDPYYEFHPQSAPQLKSITFLTENYESMIKEKLFIRTITDIRGIMSSSLSCHREN